MRFVFTAPRYHTNQHFAAKALLDAGHEVSFLVLRQGQSEYYEAVVPTVLGESVWSRLLRKLSLRLRRSGSDSVGGLPPVWKTWRKIRHLRPDAVVVRDPSSAFGLLSIGTAKLLRRAVIYYTQTPVYRELPRRKRWMRSFPAWLARAKWITPVLGSPDRFSKAVDALRYVPFVMEPRTHPSDKRWFAGGFINLLCIGKFEPRKNHRLLLAAVAALRRRYPICLTLIGECTTTDHREELSQVLRAVESLGVSDIVRIRQNLTYPQVQLEFASHDAFILPSRDEPAAVSHLEAMAHSLPVICSESNGTACYIRPGENGYVFRTDDFEQLVEEVELLIRDRKRLVEMGARSYELVVSEHSPERFVERLLSIVRESG